MSDRETISVSPQEAALLRAARKNRPQGFLTEEGLLICNHCRVQDRILLSEVEKHTPLLGDGDDFCSICDNDVKAREA